MPPKTHQGSNIGRKNTPEQRKVFKNVLGAPFSILWPRVSATLGKDILDELLVVLKPIEEYRSLVSRHKSARKKDPTAAAPTPPEVLQRLHSGINEVTRYLETCIARSENQKQHDPSLTPTVFVCKRDMKPAHLCTHLLSMAGLARIKIVPLPENAEPSLAASLGLRSASAILLDVKEGQEEKLRLLLDTVQPVKTPWAADGIPANQPYQNTYIRALETTAPLAKQKRKPEAHDQTTKNGSKKQQQQPQQQKQEQQQPQKKKAKIA